MCHIVADSTVLRRLLTEPFQRRSTWPVLRESWRNRQSLLTTKRRECSVCNLRAWCQRSPSHRRSECSTPSQAKGTVFYVDIEVLVVHIEGVVKEQPRSFNLSVSRRIALQVSSPYDDKLAAAFVHDHILSILHELEVTSFVFLLAS